MANASNFLESAITNHIFGGPDFVRPANLFFAAHLATTLNVAAAAAQPVIVTDHQPPNEPTAEIVVDVGGAQEEIFTIVNVTGVGPWNVTLSGNLVNNHALGVNVAYYPGDDGTLVREPTGGSYARVQVANNTTEFPVSATDTVTNANLISWPTATAVWGLVTHTVVYDALAAGNVLILSNRATVAEQVNLNTTLTIAAGAYTLRAA